MSHRTVPDPDLKTMPSGIPFIIGNEAAERFSFYGMKGILTVFMTKYLLDATGQPDNMSDEQAKGVYHLFTAGAYFFPILGSILADVIWGKYKTIIWISMMYCIGHGALALMDVGPETGAYGMRPLMYVGLFCIAVGAGGIKPCVSAHVGDQFGKGNKHLLTMIFNWFYFSINFGAAASTILTPILLKEYGPWAAFGLPGVLMALATFVFWCGRKRFIHVPPTGWKRFKEETFSPEGKRALLNLAPLFLIFVPAFWAIFDQTGSAWVLQAEGMDRQFLGFYWLESQVQAVNPLLILLLIPVFTYFVYPTMGRFFNVTPLRKIGIGFVLTIGAFVISALIETVISGRAPETAQAIWTALFGGGGNPGALDAVVEMARTAGWSEEVLAPFLSGADPVQSIWAALYESPVDLERILSVAQHAGWSDAQIAPLLVGPESAQAIWAGIGSTETMPAALADILTAARDAGWTNGQIAASFVGAESAPALWSSLGNGELPRTLAEVVKTARAAGWTDGQIAPYLSEMPNIGWQFIAYVVLTSAEILVSIVCLEFAYTQSPKRMKSFVMGVYFLGVSLGNFYVSGVNLVMEIFKNDDGSSILDGATYYWFFTAMMGGATVIYFFFAKTYKGETFIQGEDYDAVVAEAEAEGTDPR